MKISVRTDYLFQDDSVEDQIRLAKDAGADAVEFGEMLGYDCKKAAAAAARCGIPFLACGFYDMWNCRLGDDFEHIKQNLLRTIGCAETLGCKFLLGLPGDAPARGEEQKRRFAENMKPVAELLEKHGLVALIEPHNTILPNPVYDFSRCFVNTNRLGNELAARIGSPSVRLLFDVYHEQIMTGNLFATIQGSLNTIAHFHFSGIPGRDEPMRGEVQYQNLAREIQRLGYTGYFGLEYFPSYDAKQSLRDAIAYLKGSMCSGGETAPA